MNNPEPVKPKALFSVIALGCVLVAAALMRAAGARFAAGETLSGYGPLGITISFMVALVLCGLVTGQIGLIRGEKPLVLPVLALLLNGIIFITAVINIPR